MSGKPVSGKKTFFDNYLRRVRRHHRMRVACYLGITALPATATGLTLTGMVKALTGGDVRMSIALVAIAVFLLALLATAAVMASAASMLRTRRGIPTLFVTFDQAAGLYNTDTDTETGRRVSDLIRNSRPTGFRERNEKSPFVAQHVQAEDLPESDSDLDSDGS